jgi:CubicO group peptidase (beta-lactamase class C family)
MKRYILCCIFVMPAIITSSQTKKEKLAFMMKQYHRFDMFDGVMLVAENGKIVYEGAFGLANREWNIPNTADTKFMIGSVSKPLTATLMLIQVQKGLISLDKTVSDYLPEFKGKPAARVTIRQLLSHTSGIPNYDIIKDFFPAISRQNFTREQYIKIYLDSSLVFEPGTRYAYSSWGYFTLGYIMERVTGKSYAQLMKEEIFSKLNMTNSGSYFHTQVVPNRATGYDYSFGQYTSNDFRDQSNTMGTGDLYSTARDLFKFHLALTDHSILNKELTDVMLTPGIRPARYGFGWFNQNFKYTQTDSIAANYHLGMTDGFISFILRIPSANSFVILLCNTSPTDFFGITKNVLNTLYNNPVSLKEPLHKKMEKSISVLGAAKAVEEYRKLKTDTLRYYTDWISMTFLADQLYKAERYEEARIISENNVSEFPDRDFVMVTMGNIYMALKRKEDAIKFFKRGLELNPNYDEARSRLKELDQK